MLINNKKQHRIGSVSVDTQNFGIKIGSVPKKNGIGASLVRLMLCSKTWLLVSALCLPSLIFLQEGEPGSEGAGPLAEADQQYRRQALMCELDCCSQKLAMMCRWRRSHIL